MCLLECANAYRHIAASKKCVVRRFGLLSIYSSFLNRWIDFCLIPHISNCWIFYFLISIHFGMNRINRFSNETSVNYAYNHITMNLTRNKDAFLSCVMWLCGYDVLRFFGSQNNRIRIAITRLKTYMYNHACKQLYMYNLTIIIIQFNVHCIFMHNICMYV